MRKLSREAAREHIRSGGVSCPCCGSSDITGGNVEIDAGRAFQEVWCEECSFSWKDIYKLVEIEVEE
jgi:transposase-like protein